MFDCQPITENPEYCICTLNWRLKKALGNSYFGDPAETYRRYSRTNERGGSNDGGEREALLLNPKEFGTSPLMKKGPYFFAEVY